ncbi:hypothetical protein [uncultured Gilvimarinus sp.]|uniref:hypothetical protein n=1 Tax=uncultured Gilvimarinus sp. TaxID=1689143 RepID=UPI0030D80993
MDLDKIFSYKEVKKRKFALSVYFTSLLILFLVLLRIGHDGGDKPYIWNLSSGFLMGNVLGFYIVAIKHRFKVFRWLIEESDYFCFLLILASSIAAIYTGLNLLAGNGHEASVLGAVIAVVVCIPVTLESWIEAEKEYELARVIHTLIERKYSTLKE